MQQDDPRIIAAQGYCELGMFAEAWEELEAIDPANGQNIDLLQLKLVLLMGETHWEEAATVASALAEQLPDDPAPYLHGAYCLHEAGKTEDARDHLRRAPGRVLKEPLYHYNLACYLCVLGELEDALSYLQRAIEMDSKLRETAFEDPDLKALANQY